MPAPAFGARNYAGGAATTALSGDITNSALSLSVVDGSSYPASAFFVDIDHDTANAEKIYVGTRTGNTFSSLARGADGTTGIAHLDGAAIRHVHTAQDAAEANAASAALTTKGDIAVRLAAGGPTRLPVGADGTFLAADSTVPLGVGYSSTPVVKTLVDAKGDLIVGSADNAVGKLTAGANGTYLRANSGAGVGLEYSSDPLEVTDFATKGDIIAATANDAAAILPVAVVPGKVLTSTPAAATGLAYDYPVTVLSNAQRAALAGTELWRGRTIFNSDTGALEVYYGATTLWKPPWGTAWGWQGSRPATASTMAVTGIVTDIPSLIINYTAVANRIYKATTRVQLGSGAAGGQIILDIADASATIAGSEINMGSFGAPLSMFITSWVLIAPAAGAQLVKSRIWATVSVSLALAAGVSGTLFLEDIGPSGNAPAS